MKVRSMLSSISRAGITLIVVAAACLLGWWAWQHYRYQPWTRDGVIQAKVINIAPEVSGNVQTVGVEENQFVHKGELLFRIDGRKYRNAEKRARAALESAKQELRLARSKAERRRKLSANAISRERMQQAITHAAQASANVQAAQARLAQAKLDLQWTTVNAPVNGYVTHLLLSPGDYATAGQHAITLIDSNTFHVVAYMEETKLAKIHVGDPATIHLMAGWGKLRGHVESISHGIAVSNNGSGERSLAQVSPRFEWVHLAQRIPVRIHLDDVPADVHLSVGMSCTVTISGGNHQGQADSRSPIRSRSMRQNARQGVQ